MITRLFRRLPMPKSLRWQFTLALTAQALLIVAGGLTAVYGLRVSSRITRELAEERLVRLQEAQDLVQCTLLIERESHGMLAADSLDHMQAGYLEIQKRLKYLDSLVLRLGRGTSDLSVLALHQEGQLFRNTVHVVAQLRRNLLADGPAPSGSSGQEKTLRHFHDELQRQAVSLVDSARDLSARFTLDYRETMRQIAAGSRQEQSRVLALLAGSVLLAWLVSRYFLGRRVVARLQEVSNCLRLGEAGDAAARLPVQGDDEIGDMARAVERFLEDHRLLAEVQRNLRQSEEMLRAVIEAARTGHEADGPGQDCRRCAGGHADPVGGAKRPRHRGRGPPHGDLRPCARGRSIQKPHPERREVQ